MMGVPNWNSRKSLMVNPRRRLYRPGHCAIAFLNLGAINPSTGIPMPKTHPRMKLSREEEDFLRHWMYDEVHYRESQGPAKRLQVQHRAVPADLAVLIAAAIPDLADQEAAGHGPPPTEPPTWPWSDDLLHSRLAKARTVLALAHAGPASGVRSRA